MATQNASRTLTTQCPLVVKSNLQVPHVADAGCACSPRYLGTMYLGTLSVVDDQAAGQVRPQNGFCPRTRFYRPAIAASAPIRAGATGMRAWRVGPGHAACGFLPLAFRRTCGEAVRRRTGGSMKQHQPREATPLWVWFALGLIACGTAAYATGYLMIGDLLGFRK